LLVCSFTQDNFTIQTDTVVKTKTAVHVTPSSALDAETLAATGVKTSSHPFRSFVAGIIFIAVVVGVFVRCGGLPKLQRFLKGRETSRYRRVQTELPQ
jgi:hypothetical protein